MCAYLMRTQVLNDKLHEQYIARFISIPFPQNFSEYSGPLQQFDIEHSEINITSNNIMSKMVLLPVTMPFESIRYTDLIR